MTVALQKNLLQTLLSAVTGTGASSTFALPPGLKYLSWQLSYDVAPAAVSVTLQVSLDGTTWTTLDTSTAVGGEMRTVTNPTGALFVRVNVGTNTGSRAVTALVIVG